MPDRLGASSIASRSHERLQLLGANRSVARRDSLVDKSTEARGPIALYTTIGTADLMSLVADFDGWFIEHAAVGHFREQALAFLRASWHVLSMSVKATHRCRHRASSIDARRSQARLVEVIELAIGIVRAEERV